MSSKTRSKRKPKIISLAPDRPMPQAQIVIDNDVENPLFARAHEGERWNPRKISAARNLRESSFVAMQARKVLDETQIRSARIFLGYYETMGGSGAQAMDYTREPVDGGGAKDPISIRKLEAGFKLSEARKHIGGRAYSYVEKVIGEGYTIAQISKDHRERTTIADYLKHALDDLAALWGINRPVDFTTKTVKRSVANL